MAEIVTEQSVEVNRTRITIRYKNHDKYKTGDLGYNAVSAIVAAGSDAKIEQFAAEVPETVGGGPKRDAKCALERVTNKMQDRLEELREQRDNNETLEEAAEDALTAERVQNIHTMMVEIENVRL
jgi:hypothetical protein